MSKSNVSLPDVHRSVAVPQNIRGWKRILAFAGPAYLISVGYMDPGNWATDIEGGARFGYSLLWVLVMSNLMAILLQTLSARLGIASGRDLAQACRDEYPPFVSYSLWIFAEIAIAACDLAEVIGTAIGLNLLFGIPLFWGVLITSFDSLLLLGIQSLGMRKFEAFILTLIITIGLCFIFELFLSKPDFSLALGGFIPHLPDGALYVAIGIIGATVMPHNLYLHSALVQTRAFEITPEGKKNACKFNLIDSIVALNGAFFVNASILILAAAVFFSKGIEVKELQDAYKLISPLLGTKFAGIAFAVALLSAGQSSTLTGTLAGQIIMEGFLKFKIRPFLRRLVTRSLAIIPALLSISFFGDGSTYKLLIFSQVILSMQLSFAVIPLIRFTGDRNRMGELANSLWVKIISWLTAGIIVILNIWLVYSSISEWISSSQNPALQYIWLIPLSAGMLFLLVYVAAKPLRKSHSRAVPAWYKTVNFLDMESDALELSSPHYQRIGVAVDFSDNDKRVLEHVVGLAEYYKADLFLFHIVEGASGIVLGEETNSAEAREDAEYLEKLVAILQKRGLDAQACLGFGNVPKAIVRLSQETGIDILIMGGHGHRGISDFLFGETIAPVRHLLKIPVLIIR